MHNKSLTMVTRSVLLLLLAVVVVCSALAAPQADAAASKAAAAQQDPAIKKLEGVKLDYSDYLDSNVFHPLPESVKDDQEISVIITLPVLDLMDAYEQSAKTMSITEYALSDEAAAITKQVADERDRFLAVLDAQGISYTVGELYDTLLGSADLSKVAAVKEKYAALPEHDLGEHWYDSIKLPVSLSKKGKKAQSAAFDACAMEYLEAFLDSVEAAPYCDPAEKKEKASVYVEGLLTNGGPSTDVFKKGIGEEKTGLLFRNFLFGTAR